MFFKGSRYANVQTLEIVTADGRVIKYKAVRFIPKTDPRQGHGVQRGERLDQIAYVYFRDPERFWRIADANTVMWPEDLTAAPGRIILIPASEG